MESDSGDNSAIEEKIEIAMDTSSETSGDEVSCKSYARQLT